METIKFNEIKMSNKEAVEVLIDAELMVLSPDRDTFWSAFKMAVGALAQKEIQSRKRERRTQ